jgi:hypothetical protein
MAQAAARNRERAIGIVSLRNTPGTGRKRAGGRKALDLKLT